VVKAAGWIKAGMCARSVEQTLKKTDGVKDARVSYEKGTAWIEYDDGKVTVARLSEVIDGTGFKAAGVVSNGRGPSRRTKRRANSRGRQVETLAA